MNIAVIAPRWHVTPRVMWEIGENAWLCDVYILSIHRGFINKPTDKRFLVIGGDRMVKRLCPEHLEELTEDCILDTCKCPQGHLAETWLLLGSSGQILGAASYTFGGYVWVTPNQLRDCYRYHKKWIKDRQDRIANLYHRTGDETLEGAQQLMGIMKGLL